jgi:hypothetical protein
MKNAEKEALEDLKEIEKEVKEKMQGAKFTDKTKERAKIKKPS